MGHSHSHETIHRHVFTQEEMQKWVQETETVVRASLEKQSPKNDSEAQLHERVQHLVEQLAEQRVPEKIASPAELVKVLKAIGFFCQTFPKIVIRNMHESGLAKSFPQDIREEVEAAIRTFCTHESVQILFAENLFSCFDLDRNGSVDASELSIQIDAWNRTFSGYDPLGNSDVDRLVFSQLDSDGSGTLDIQEIESLVLREVLLHLRMLLLLLIANSAAMLFLHGREQSKSKTKKYLNKTTQLVAIFDKRRANVESVYVQHGAEIRAEWFRRADLDANNSISFEEFVKARKPEFCKQFLEWAEEKYLVEENKQFKKELGVAVVGLFGASFH